MGPKFENLMINQLEGAKGTEVVVSHVVVPPHTTLPKHFHPGEEFAYITEGSVTLLIDGKESIKLSKGNAGVVPYKLVHTIKTDDEACEMVVFRVHESGAPERVLV